jgi:hypothetical protein
MPSITSSTTAVNLWIIMGHRRQRLGRLSIALGRGQARCLDMGSCSRRRGHMGRGPGERALAVWLLARDDCLPTPSE